MSVMRRFSQSLASVIKAKNDDIPTPTSLNGPAEEKQDGTPVNSPRSEYSEGDEQYLTIDDECFLEEPTNHRRIREVRRSWPQTAQESEFRYGITVRGRQTHDNDSKRGSTGKAIDGLSSASHDADEQLSSSFSTHSQSDVQVRQTINWEALPEDKVCHLDRSTVWFGGSGLFDIEQNDVELARIASLFTPNKQEKKVSISKAARESVLDNKRATTISVAMKRMRLAPAKFGKLAWALRDMNESYLTPTAVEILMKSQVWATPKELEDMKARQRDGFELADPDALLWFLATSVPDMSARVSALAFRYEFDEIVGELIRATSLIKAASLEVCSSELLKRLMRVVLLIGNNINESQGGTAAVRNPIQWSMIDREN